MNIAVYCGSSSGNDPRFTQSAKELGKWIGDNGHTLVYGGANKGLMGAVAGAVIEAGGKVIGVIPDVAIIQARKYTGLTELI
ncbi:MAG: TIGR00730 family Rossman fold protein, partial [Butyrivibrio sp.]|nr:TIGR00730 family Rossman fold protein [Butyrivibrio sp.]